MATLSRARALSSSGGIQPRAHVYCQSGNQPIAALLAARRSYWTLRGSKSDGHASNDGQHYMCDYPYRAQPRYARHSDGLRCAYGSYLTRGRSPSSRSSSHWTNDDKEKEKGQATVPPRAAEIPWETRTRIAGERYLRLMEEHMALLRKDPYWGLFGASELRGVWNPWKNSEPLRRRVDERTWHVWQESRKAAEHLRRTVKGEFWDESNASSKSVSPKQPTGTDQEAQTSPNSPHENAPADEYVYDPISNKRVRRSLPSNVNDVPLKPSNSLSYVIQAPSTYIPVSKYDASSTTNDEEIRDSQPPASLERDERTFERAKPQERSAKLAGFAQAPWLLREGFVPSSRLPVDCKSSKRESAFGLQRAERQHQQELAELRQRQQSEKELIEVLQGSSVKLHKLLRLSQGSKHEDSMKMKQAHDAVWSNWVSRQAKILEKRGANRDDKDIDALRPDTIRATMDKTASSTSSKATRQGPLIRGRKPTLQDINTATSQSREDRLRQEFAVVKWDLKRNWSAYPGDIARTPEEKRERRRLLERAFAISVDLMELEVSKIVNLPTLSLAASLNRGSESLRAGFLEKEPTGLLESQLGYDREQRQAAASVALQKEVDVQRIAMSAHESKVRASNATSSPLVQNVFTTPAAKVSAVTARNEQQKAQERSLVREIRDIYESTYGVIDTKHRQKRIAPTSIVPSLTDAPTKSKLADRLKTSLERTLIKKVPEARPEVRQEVRTAAVAAAPSVSSERPKREERSSAIVAAEEPEAAKHLLETSVKDFEQIMSKESTNSGKHFSSEISARPVMAPASEVDHIRPITQEASDSLVAELADIAVQAPKVAAREKSTEQLESSPQPIPQSFIVLSFDKRKEEVRALRTTSTSHEQSSKHRTVESIMSRLDNPFAYFEHMTQLEKAGYELVAGSRKALVYKDIIGRKSDLIFDTDTATAVKPEHGWGSPTPDSRPKEAKSDATSTRKPASSGQSRPVRRVEESFSGIPPRLESERIAEEIDAIQKTRSTPVWRAAKWTLIIATLFYSFGVTLEWLKDREKRRLVAEYQQEVKRVQEVERRKAQEHAKSTSWSF